MNNMNDSNDLRLWNRNSWDEVFLVGQRFTLADVAASIPLYHFQQQATLPLRPGTSETHGTYEELPIWLGMFFQHPLLLVWSSFAYFLLIHEVKW